MTARQRPELRQFITILDRQSLCALQKSDIISNAVTAEINDFEEQLDQHNILLLKCWLQISEDEQLRRFEERQQIGFKHFKITEDDWRNRKKWDDYQTAACDMIDRTSTSLAPWTLVEANDKNYARIKILRILCERLEEELNKKS